MKARPYFLDYFKLNANDYPLVSYDQLLFTVKVWEKLYNMNIHIIRHTRQYKINNNRLTILLTIA